MEVYIANALSKSLMHFLAITSKLLEWQQLQKVAGSQRRKKIQIEKRFMFSRSYYHEEIDFYSYLELIEIRSNDQGSKRNSPIGEREAQIFEKRMIDSIIGETKGGFLFHPLALEHSVAQTLHKSTHAVDCRLQSQDHHPPHFARSHKASLQTNNSIPHSE